jgi:hypothetical protein
MITIIAIIVVIMIIAISHQIELELQRSCWRETEWRNREEPEGETEWRNRGETYRRRDGGKETGEDRERDREKIQKTKR